MLGGNYLQGSEASFSVVFLDPLGPTDPSQVDFYYRDPNNSFTVYSYGTSSQLIRDGQGSYHVLMVLSIPGQAAYRFRGFDLTLVDETPITIRPSQFPQ